jgi:hypothetical protein
MKHRGVVRWLAGVVLPLVLTTLTAAAQPPPTTGTGSDSLEHLRTLYLEAVSREGAIAQGLDEVAALRARARPPRDPALEATLTAYEGALVTLRAKHALWPPRKLRYLRQGLALLDEVVDAHPEHAEARYLRLMSCYYLPAILGRSDSVREDFAALARLLPGVRSRYSAPLYRAIAGFVLENGALPREDRLALERSLAEADG